MERVCNAEETHGLTLWGQNRIRGRGDYKPRDRGQGEMWEEQGGHGVVG